MEHAAPVRMAMLLSNAMTVEALFGEPCPPQSVPVPLSPYQQSTPSLCPHITIRNHKEFLNNNNHNKTKNRVREEKKARILIFPRINWQRKEALNNICACCEHVVSHFYSKPTFLLLINDGRDLQNST